MALRGPRPNEEERVLLSAFKHDARLILCTDAKVRLLAMLRSPDVPDDLFLRTFEIIANRVGLPPAMQHQVEDITPGREVVNTDRPIAWLAEGTDALARDHDGRSAGDTAQ